MKNKASALRELGSIMGAGKKGAKSPDEMIDAKGIRDMAHPQEMLRQILGACAELPEVGDFKIHKKAGEYLKVALSDVGDEGNAALGEIIGEACYAIAGRGEKAEEEAMQYITSATCLGAASREFAEALLERIAGGNHGSQLRTRLFLAVMSFYYYQIAKAGARKGDEEQGKEQGN